MEGYQVFPSKCFLSQSAEKNCRVTLQCFRNIFVWEKIYGEEMGGITFPVEFSCLTVRKNFVVETFCAVSESFR